MYFYSEKQVSVARCQPLELFCNVFIQAFLSLLAAVTLVFGVNKTLWHGVVSQIALAQTGTLRSWKGLGKILFHSTSLSK